ncbi:MAG: PH domain-containing protein [Candidatus Thorarchaeota archaeon]
MTESSQEPFPPEKRERLVTIFYPKRASFIFYYVLGTVVFIVGTGFMTVTSLPSGPYRDLVAWLLSAGAMVFGIFLVAWAESRRWFTLYIITTWNVRVRKGVFKRKTTRVFYDEIIVMHCSGPPDERKVGMGDVEIFTTEGGEPALVFDGVHNPDGVREIINRFVETIPDPVPWTHLDRG